MQGSAEIVRFRLLSPNKKDPSSLKGLLPVYETGHHELQSPVYPIYFLKTTFTAIRGVAVAFL